MTSFIACKIMYYMERETNYQRLVSLRLGEQDLQRLEEIAKQERTSVSAIVRRFIVEGLEHYFGQSKRKQKKGR